MRGDSCGKAMLVACNIFVPVALWMSASLTDIVVACHSFYIGSCSANDKPNS